MEEAYQSTSLKQLLEFSKAQFRYWTEDAFASRFRRLLTLEQYRSETMGKLYQQYLAAGPMGYVADLFAGMGFSEPQEKAASFYAPMFLLYTVYDGAEASEKEAVLALADACLEQSCKFVETGKGGDSMSLTIRRETEKRLSRSGKPDTGSILECIPPWLHGALCTALLPRRQRLCAGTGFCHGAGWETHRPCDVRKI